MFGRRPVELPEPPIEREDVVAMMYPLIEIRALARRIARILEDEDDGDEGLGSDS